MITLDTSALSEPLLRSPHANVIRCLDAQSVRAASRAAGAALGDLDAMIAAIAVTRSASIATRDTARFLAAGIPVTDPFVAAD